MAFGRYDYLTPIINKEETYKKFLDERNISHFRQYRMYRCTFPTAQELLSLSIVGHVWTVGDRLYKLAHQYYGNSEYWWIIAWFNQKPTEAHYSIGDSVDIPLPLDKMLTLYAKHTR